MIGDDADLVVVELVALGDQLHQMEHRLRRDVHGEPVAVEARDGGMRLEAGMRLRAGAEGAFDQQRIVRRARAVDPAPRLLRLSARTPPTVRGRCRSRAPARRAPSETLPAFLRLDFSNTTGASGLRAASSPITDGRRSLVDLDGGDRGQRGLAVLRRDGGDRLADIADDAVVAEQRDRRADAGHRERRREIEFADSRMRELRAQDHAFELAVMTDVDGVFRRSRHLVARLDARRQTISPPSNWPAQAAATALKMPS